MSADRRAWALQTEVLYGVIAMGPSALEKLLSLEALLAGIQLHASQQQTDPWYRILRRRIAQILGAQKLYFSPSFIVSRNTYVTASETWGCREPKLSQQVYGLVYNLMNDTDLVVRLYGIMALRGDILLHILVFTLVYLLDLTH